MPDINTQSLGKHLFEQDHILFKNSWTRVDEYEADRFAILEFGVKIEDAISLIESKLCGHDDIKSTSSFELTHPIAEKRIEQLLDLQVELELRSRRSKKLIDWARLAQEYRDFSMGQMGILVPI